MKLDIDKFSEWLEKTVRAGIADERALRELKLGQKLSAQSKSSHESELLKAQ